MMNADGTNVRQLTGEGRNHEPAWSPNGKQIVFHSFRNDDAEIFVMNADGRGLYSTGQQGYSPSFGG
jgi:Tol biopolymer transport system component